MKTKCIKTTNEITSSSSISSKNCYFIYVYVNNELMKKCITADEASEMRRREQYLREHANGRF